MDMVENATLIDVQLLTMKQQKIRS